MTIVHIKKVSQQRTAPDGSPQDGYAVPCMSIATPAGRRLMPNPIGQEAQVFDTLEEAVEAIRRAGFDYVFEGRTTHLLDEQKAQTIRRAGGSTGRSAPTPPMNTGRPMEDAVPTLVALLA